jgi:drug/metabolite transporter (DMT)-like permease
VPYNQTNKKDDSKKNPILGHLLFNLYVIFISASTMIATLLYKNVEGLNASQALTLRGIIAFALTCLLAGKQVTKALYVPKEKTNFLMLRCLMGALGQNFLLAAPQYLPLVYNSISTNAAPVMTVIVSAIVLKEKVQLIHVALILISAAGVACIILGKGKKTDDEPSDPPPLWIVIGLFLAPVLLAFGAILTTKL